MKRRLSCVLLVILLILALQLPVFANTMNYDSYVPPLGPLNTQNAVVTDANNFIKQFYNLPTEGGDYFTPSAAIPSGSSYTIAPLQVDMTYNISDMSQLGGFQFPMIYYNKQGGGPGRDQQFLGQTKEGYTITNVRFPMVANWSFIEDLAWYPTYSTVGKDWWKQTQGADVPKPEKLPVNIKANSDKEFAEKLDFCIAAPILQQLRTWNGQEYYMSKALANAQGQPAKPGEEVACDFEQLLNFPWHEYVNILTPPTVNTWGYGIGFYNYNGKISYKSFPIGPLGMELPLDISVSASNTTLTAAPGETVDITFGVKSNRDVRTPVAVTKYGSGWQTLEKDFGQDVMLNKGDPQIFTYQVTMPSTPTQLVVGANYRHDSPTTELSFDNNYVVFNLKPNVANQGYSKEGYLAWNGTYPFTYYTCQANCCCNCDDDDCDGCCNTIYTNPTKQASLSKLNQIWVMYNGDTAPRAQYADAVPNGGWAKPYLYQTGYGINDIWRLKPGGIWSHYKTAIEKGSSLGLGGASSVNQSTYPELATGFSAPHNKVTSAGYIMNPLAGNGNKVTITVRTSLFTQTGSSPHSQIVDYIMNNTYVTMPTSRLYPAANWSSKVPYRDESLNNRQVKLEYVGGRNHYVEYSSNFNDKSKGGTYENIDFEQRKSIGGCGGSCSGDWLQPAPKIGHYIETTTFTMQLPVNTRVTDIVNGDNKRAFMISLKEAGADKHLGAKKQTLHVKSDFSNDFYGLRPCGEPVVWSQRGMHIANGGNPNNIFYFGIYGNKYDDIQIRQILK